MKKVAVTGSLASGKSTVCAYFRECGAYVVDCDRLLHNAFDQNESLKRSLVQTLGTTIVLEDGSLSRSRMAHIVFSDRERLHAVETICHQYVFSVLQSEFEKARGQQRAPQDLFVAEVPLLYESEVPMFQTWFDIAIFVYAPPSVCCTRYINLGKTQEDFEKRERRFLSDGAKREKAHFVIENTGRLDDLQKNVLDLFQKIQKQA